MKRLLTAVLVMLGMVCPAEVLWWTVSEDDTINNSSQTLYDFLSPLPYSGYIDEDTPYIEYVAQIAVRTTSGEEIKVLPIDIPTGETNPYSGNPMYIFDPT